MELKATNGLENGERKTDMNKANPQKKAYNN